MDRSPSHFSDWQPLSPGEVFDLRGRRLATLWNGILGPEPGVVQWDGTDQLGRAVPGGAYLFRIFGQGDRQTTRKGILLK